jgi:hypothetical protein
MPMAFMWVYLGAHERNGMLKSVQKRMKIEFGWDYIRVVPSPDYLATSSFDCLSPNVARHTKLPKVGVADPILFQEPSQVGLAQLGTIHTNRILPNVQKSSHAVPLQGSNNLFCLPPGVAKSEKIRCLR